MARSIQDIQDEMIKAVQANEQLSELTSTSKVSVWRLMIFIVATAIWSIETLFDHLRDELNELVVAQKAHSLRWYRTKALAFQFGHSLSESDTYDNSTRSEERLQTHKWFNTCGDRNRQPRVHQSSRGR